MRTIIHKRARDGWQHCTVIAETSEEYVHPGMTYAMGWMKPNYPVPAPLWVSDTATGYDKLNWTCCPCLCHFTDQLWDDYYISKGEMII